MLLHELAHYAAGIALGNSMKMNLNLVRPLSAYVHPSHPLLVAAAGPVATMIQATGATAAMFLHRERGGWLVGFAGFPVVYRVWPYVVSSSTQQDEVLVGVALGLGWAVPVMIWCALGALAFAGARRTRAGWRSAGLFLAGSLTWFQIILRLNNWLWPLG